MKTTRRGHCRCGDSAAVGGRSRSRREAIAERDIPELKGGDWGGARAFFGERGKVLSLPQGPRARRGDRPGPLEPGPPRLRLGVPRHPHARRRHQSRLYRAHRRAGRRPRAERDAPHRGGRLIVGDSDGRQTVVDRAEVEATSPSSTSIMPEGWTRRSGRRSCATC